MIYIIIYFNNALNLFNLQLYLPATYHLFNIVALFYVFVTINCKEFNYFIMIELKIILLAFIAYSLHNSTFDYDILL